MAFLSSAIRERDATMRADGGSFSGTMTASNTPGEGMVTRCSVTAGCTFTDCTLHAFECP